ncbi:MAG TPA: DUF192 domain-containing protein [Arenimonas sp.]|nr:DUF192 domain-containing protein [Arenimonas sp.]HPO25131.1 DUF192 domain-containing protein [Arenimonas sp.]
MRIFSLLLLVFTLPACSAMQSKPWVEIRGQRFTVEVADSFEERERGLMFRDELAKDSGMLFIHDNEETQAYWMKNTHIPLDILYFNKDRKLVSAQERVPACSAGDRCPPYASEGAALYVLELNAGSVELYKIQAGDEMKISPDIKLNATP